MKLNYKQRLFVSFFIIFVVFFAALAVLQQRSERNQKIEVIEDRLARYIDVTERYIKHYQLTDSTFSQLQSLENYLLNGVRVSIISPEGKLLYDSDIADTEQASNHIDRPEIQKAMRHSYGRNIRLSASTGQEYVYFAKYFPEKYFIRMALPFDEETKVFFRANWHFIYMEMLLLFVAVLIMLNFVAGRFGKSISQLKDFTQKVKNDDVLPKNTQFPNDELGEIGSELAEIFKQKIESKEKIETEREKLIKHFQSSDKGICIYTPDFKQVYANTHYIHYLNLMLDKPVFDVGVVFESKIFNPIVNFLKDKDKKQNIFSYQISEAGKIYSIQLTIFDDKSFEISIQDITKTEKTRLLKQQMTSNIAHELRTPVTSLRAYLETLTEQQISPEQQAQFIERAYQQSIRLSELIDDVSLISKLEEASSQFNMEKINLLELTNGVKKDISGQLAEKNIKLNISIEPDVSVTGNQTLLYSVFRNLADNTIKYGGENIEIHINNYLEDEHYYYFSYYDTGKGIAEEHLNRLFERFYRIDNGRTRDAGGSGLGLSIVKNVILLHKGKIQAKIHSQGGLQFLFTLKK